MSAERVLTQRQLNRAVLARQLLLERADLPPAKALERIGGIQAQYAPSMYIGLWTRLANLGRVDLTAALERRSVVQGTLMRVTIHLVSRRDYWPIALATRAARRALWLRTHKDVTEEEMAHAAASVATALHAAPDGVLTRKDLDAIAGKEHAIGVGLWRDLVRVPPSGTWDRRRADLFGDAEAWLGAADATPQEGAELLVRRYLSGFGPAAPADVAAWAGIPVTDVTAALERLPLRRFRAEDGTALVDLPRLPLPAADTPAPVRFLPTFDATLLAHARRARILPEEHRPKVFHTKMPQSVGTFLVDGSVAGRWRLDRGGRVVAEPFGRLDAADRRALDAEAERLAAFCADPG